MNALARFAQGWIAVVVMVAWGFGEAIILPIVPDVLLYVLVVAAPRRAAPLFAWVLMGALVGSVVLSALVLSQPSSGRGLVLSVPGVTDQTLTAAEAAVRTGDPLGMVHLGPGIPLKVYTVAWWAGAGTAAGYVVGVIANRLVRIGAGVLVFAIVGAMFPGSVRRRERMALAAYVVFWIVISILAARMEASPA